MKQIHIVGVPFELVFIVLDREYLSVLVRLYAVTQCDLMVFLTRQAKTICFQRRKRWL